MRKWLLLSVAVIGLAGAPRGASAEPITTVAALMANGVGFWSAITATYGAFATAALQVGTSVVLSSVGAALTRQMPSTPELKREFPVRTSLPGKRYAYGHTRLTGTPVPWRVRGRVLYGCILFNSRPSDGGNLSLTLDGRDCAFVNHGSGTELTDPADWAELFDFGSAGQLVKIKEKFPDWDRDEEQFVCWLGLGDQDAPPARIVSEVPEFFQASDAWKGQTVLWVRMQAGGNLEKRVKRWPNPEPMVELEMDWSKVWDPQDSVQDKDDPESWTYSDNQARCLLDAVRQNPLRAYTSAQLLEETFLDAVPLADEAVLRWFDTQAAGSDVFEQRYRVAGVIDWSKGELLDLIQPLADAGAGQLAVVGGKLSYIPGSYQAPVYTMTDILGDSGVEFQRLGSRREVPFALKGAWTSEEQEYGTAELEPWLVPGGSTRSDEVEDLALPMVPSGTQCQRVVKINALRRAAQKRLTCILPPSAVRLIPGSGVAAALPAPFTRLNGTWQVQEAQPGVWLQDGEEGRVAFRVPVTLREDAPAIYAWDPAADELEIQTQSLTEENVFLGTVTGLAAQTVEVNSGGAVILMVAFEFDPVTGYAIDEYEVAWRASSSTEFTPLPDIPGSAIGDSGKVSGRFGPVGFGTSYDLRVRGVGPTSEGLWSYVLGIIAGVGVAGVTATAGPARLEVAGTASSEGYLAGMRLYRAPVGGVFNDAVQVGEDIPVAPDAAFSIVFGDPEAVDLVSNGDFADSSGWTLGGGWSISGGIATHDGASSGGTLGQASGALVAGAQYRLSAHVTAISGAGAAACQLVGDTVVSGDLFTSTGRKVSTVTAPTSPATLRLVAATNQLLSVNSFSVVAQTPDALPGGEARFWLVPYTASGANGTPTALGTFTIT
ncbi:phage tail protein [Salipiger sp. H15]|uniref:Phage tail protein n=1 Tax=Alloyangia sp. H15 TaxID=3029062 RepID=A0AAU8AEX1_9RHOB